MFAHFAGDMREHVALTREIDPEHRSRQNLGHRALHHDLFFLRHGAGIYSGRSPAQGGSASPKTMPNICGFAAILTNACRRTRSTSSFLMHIFQGNARQILAKFLAFPPGASLSMLLRGRETVAVKCRANIPGRTLWKRIPLEQRRDFRLAVQ